MTLEKSVILASGLVFILFILAMSYEQAMIMVEVLESVRIG